MITQAGKQAMSLTELSSKSEIQRESISDQDAQASTLAGLAREAWGKGVDLVEEHPYAAAGVALAVGAGAFLALRGRLAASEAFALGRSEAMTMGRLGSAAGPEAVPVGQLKNALLSIDSSLPAATRGWLRAEQEASAMGLSRVSPLRARRLAFAERMSDLSRTMNGRGV